MTAAGREAAIEEMREQLLADRGDLIAKAKSYVAKRYFDGYAYNTSASIIAQFNRYGSITEKQWKALAGFVAFVDARDDSEER